MTTACKLGEESVVMADPDAVNAASSSPPRAAQGPLVFISHDSRDAALAEAFSKLLGNVSAGMLKTFRSSDKKGSQGFEYGVEWYPELMKTLESACDVVCLLTERGLGRPWMLYEAGVAKGKLDIPVHGLALGVPLAKAGVGPFAQFQNCGDDTDSLTKLVVQLVQRLPHADPDHETVRSQVEAFRKHVDELLSPSANADEQGETGAIEASPAKLFEEIKVMFQDLPSRLERAVLEDTRSPRSRARRFRPELFEEMLYFASRSEQHVGLAALVAASFIRDDFPWLYELGVEVYRSSLRGDIETERRALLTFMGAFEMLAYGPLARDPRMARELTTIWHELRSFTDHYLSDHSKSPDAEEE